MAHTHDLEWEVGSKRIICMYDDCNFVMEEKDIIAIIGNHAAQQMRALDVCPVCEGKGKVANTHGVEQFCIPCDGTRQRQ